jgi:hypothetical protein
MVGCIRNGGSRTHMACQMPQLRFISPARIWMVMSGLLGGPNPLHRRYRMPTVWQGCEPICIDRGWLYLLSGAKTYLGWSV